MTPSAIIIVESHTLRIIANTDIVWVYPKVVTQKMNFIPMQKMHMIFLTTKTGECFNLGMTNTGGFSKKDPLEEYLQKMKEITSKVNPDIVFGYSEEINAHFNAYFNK